MTEDNIVRFPNAQTHSKKEAERKKTLAIEDLYKIITDNIKPGQSLSPEDAATVSRNLHAELVRARRDHGISLGNVLHKAKCGGETAEVATRYLSQYATAENRTPSKRLRKKISSFQKIAKEAATQSGEPEDRWIVRVFSGTSLCERQTPIRDIDPAYKELADVLKRVTDGISQKHNLTQYFRDVNLLRLAFLLDCDQIKQDDAAAESAKINSADSAVHTNNSGTERRKFIADHKLWIPASHSFIEFPYILSRDNEAESYVGDSYILPYPSIPMCGYELCAGSFIVDLHAREDNTLPDLLVECSLHIVFDLRLCIIPVGESFTPKGALRVDMMSVLGLTRLQPKNPNEEADVELVDSRDSYYWPKIGDKIDGRPSHSFIGDKEKIRVHFKYGSQACDATVVEINKPTDAEVRRIMNYFTNSDNASGPQMGIRFFRLNADVFADWLSLSTCGIENAAYSSNNYKKALGEPICQLSSGETASLLPSMTLASSIDEALFHKEFSLDMMLDDRAAALCARLKGYRDYHRSRRKEALNKLYERWPRPQDEE